MALGRLGLIGASNTKRTSGVYSFDDNLNRENAKSLLTNFSYDGKFNALTQAGAAQGFTFNNSGTTLLVATPGTRATAKITEWSLSTPFDITTAVYQSGRDFLCGDYEPSVNALYAQPDYDGAYYFGGLTNDTIWFGVPGDTSCIDPQNKKFYLGTQDATPRSTRFSSDGLTMYTLGSTNRNVYQYTLTTPYNITTASYASKTLAVTQDTTPQHIFFKSDGTKMYMLGSTSQAMFSYTLSTPWDVSTGTSDYSAPLSYQTSAQATAPRSVFFGDSGTKMYVLSYVLGSPTVYQYTLSTAYNPTTATYASKSLNVNARDTEPWEILFKSDGTKMYMLGNTSDIVYSYTLSTPWDVSTGTADYTPRSFTVTTQAAEPYNTYIGDNGTKMFVLNQATNAVFQYTLSTPYNVTTAVYASKTLSTATQDTDSRGLFFRSNGSKMYVLGNTNDAVFSYTLATPWDVSTGTADYTPKSFLHSAQTTTSNDLFIGDNGTKLYVLSGAAATTDTVFQYTLSVAWDITSATYASKSFSVNTQSSVSQGLFFKSDGAKMYVVNDSNDSIFQYSLSTPWDVSTATYDSISFSVATQEATPTGIFFSSDGTRMYIGGLSGDDVNEYILATPWIINTASFVRVSALIGDANQTGIRFKNDGTKMYVAGATTQSILEYDLATAWDVSSFTLARSLSIAFLDTAPTGLEFKSDGTKVFIIGDTGDRVYELSLSIPWQVTSVVGRYSAVLEEPTCTSMYISPDGLNMYITGQTGDDVNQYALSSAWDISSASFVRVSASHGEATPTGIFFKDDGTRMSIVGTTLDTIREFTLSTPWDVSTLTFDRSRFIGQFDGTMTGIHISPDGLTMYLTGGTNNTIYQFTLSQAWRSTYLAGYLYAASVEATCTAMYISPDGLNLYITGQTGDDVNQYLLDVAWDIGSANHVRVSAGHGEGTVTGIFFKDDGTRMYITGSTLDTIREFTLATPWDVSSITLVDSFYIGHIATAPTTLHFSPDGLYMYFINTTLVYRFTLAVAWGSNKVLGTYSVNKEEATPTAFHFSSTGLDLYVTGQTGDDVNQYSLSTAWDITTISYVRVSATHGEAAVSGLTIDASSGTLYVCGTTLDTIRRFSISGGDVSTLTFFDTFSIGFEATSSGISLSGDGATVFLTGTTNDCVYSLFPQFAGVNGSNGYAYIGGSEANMRSLTVPVGASSYQSIPIFSGGSAIRKYSSNGLETTTLSQTLAITEPYGIHVNSKGTRIYVALGTTAADKSGRSIRLVNMTTPFDLSTATLDSVEVIGAPGLIGNPANLWNIYVTPDEMRMFVLSPTVQGIYQFSRKF